MPDGDGYLLCVLYATGAPTADPPAVLPRGNDRAVWELRWAYPHRRLVIARVFTLSQDLERRLPRQPKAEAVSSKKRKVQTGQIRLRVP